MKRLRVYNILINHAYKELKQSTISHACKCTKEYTSKIVQKLLKKGILTKTHRNSVFVKNPLILCILLSFEQKNEKPLLFKASKFEDIKTILDQTTYSITAESAISIKKGENPEIITAYVLRNDTNVIESNLQRARKNPDLIIHPRDYFSFQNQQLVNNTFLSTDYEIFTDLLSMNKTSKAFEFAKKYKLFKNI